MNILRFLAAAPPGLAITAGLLFAMQALIDSGVVETPGDFPVRPIMARSGCRAGTHTAGTTAATHR